MKILVISHSAILRVNQFLYEELASRGHEINVIVPKTWSSGGLGKNHTWQNNENVRIIPVETSFSGNGSLYFLNTSLRKILKEYKPDVLFIDEEPWSLIMLQALWALRSFKEIKLITYTKQNIYKKYPWPFSLIEKWCYRRSHCLLSIGKECSDVLRDKGYSGTIAVFPHAVNLELFPFMPSSRSADQKLRLGYIGRFVEAKGGADLIHAVKLLKERGLEVDLTFLGGGEAQSDWENLVSELNLEGCVFFRPALTHLEVPKGYQTFDVICLPSRTTPSWKEQFGRVIIEAASTGRPVIGSDSGEIPHVINSLSNGLIFSEGDADMLAKSIEELIVNCELYNQMALEGRQRVEELYSYSAIGSVFENCCSR